MTSEAEFLNRYRAADFERPSLAVDVALVTADGGRLRVLMVRRAEHPQKGRWQLPGGFVDMDESLDDAAERVLATKAGVRGAFTEQLYTFGAPGRDPRTRVVSVAYYALIDPARLPLDDSQVLATIEVPWAGEQGGPVTLVDPEVRTLQPAFDHAAMVSMVVKRLRGKLRYSPVGYELLPREFTLLDLQQIHETILGEPTNKDSFRRRMLASGELVATGERREGVGHRPAALYRITRS